MAVTSIDYTVTPANFKTALANVQDRMVESDWPAAWLWVGIAEMQHSGLAASKEMDSIRVTRRDSLAAARHALEAAQSANSGLWEVHSRMVP